MTLFIIVFAVFLAVEFSARMGKRNKAQQYRKQLAKEKICKERMQGALNKLIQEYMEEASHYSAEELFPKTSEMLYYSSQTYDDISKWYNSTHPYRLPYKTVQYNIEIDFLCLLAEAKGLPREKDFIRQIFVDKDWNFLPSEFSQEFLSEWKTKYPTGLTDEYLSSILELCIEIKNKMLECPDCIACSKLVIDNLSKKYEVTYYDGKYPYCPNLGRLSRLITEKQLVTQ